MQTSQFAARPVRPVPVHSLMPPPEANHDVRALHNHAQEEAAPRARAVARAEAMGEPLSDWQVFALLGGTAGGMVSFGIAALYGLSLLLP